MKQTNQQGFTLIELSIVLVIIGLLIGGILAAQSMINTTKIQAFARQLGQFDAAVVNFKDKYGGLPGDTSTVSGAVAGNGDNGIIEDADTPTYAAMAGEMSSFWPNLSTSGLKSDSGSAYATSWASGEVLTGSSNNAPKAKLGNNSTGVVAYGVSAANYYVIGDLGDMTTTAIDCDGAFSHADALAVDVKLDEGTSNAGQVQSSATDEDDLSTFAAVAAYAPTTAGTPLYMRVRIGTQAGTLE